MFTFEAVFSQFMQGCGEHCSWRVSTEKKKRAENFYFTKSLYQGIIIKWKSI